MKWAHNAPKFMCKNIYSSIIFKRQIMGTIQISINRRMNIMWVYHTVESDTEMHMNELLVHLEGSHNVDWKKLNIKEYIVYDSVDVKFKQRSDSLLIIRSQSVVLWGGLRGVSGPLLVISLCERRLHECAHCANSSSCTFSMFMFNKLVYFLMNVAYTYQSSISL